MAARFFSQAARQLRPLQPILAVSRPITSVRSGLVIRAMSSDGQITSELIQGMQQKIQDALQAQKVVVADVQGDGRHVEIVVVSKEFEGKNAVNRQRMVYKVREIHLRAVEISVYTIQSVFPLCCDTTAFPTLLANCVADKDVFFSFLSSSRLFCK